MTAARKHSSSDSRILGEALVGSLVKLNPRRMIKNPVMFITETGAVVTTGCLVFDPANGSRRFVFQVALWLWFTVLFANFAEALAEGRGKAQANALRKTRTRTMARLLGPMGDEKEVPAEKLRKNDLVMVSAGEIIPGDG